VNPRPSRPASDSGLSVEFDHRLLDRLELADGVRHRRAAIRRWQWLAFLSVPLIAALGWAVLPITFGDGVRAIIGLVGYITMLLAVAERFSRGYLGYLNLSPVPVLVDVLLLVGVVSWLIWAARDMEASTHQEMRP